MASAWQRRGHVLLTAPGVTCLRTENGKGNLLWVGWPAFGSQHLRAAQNLHAVKKGRINRRVRQEDSVRRLVEGDSCCCRLTHLDPDCHVTVAARS